MAGLTNPLVMRFVDVFIEYGQVQPPVNPIDEVVREHEETIRLFLETAVAELEEKQRTRPPRKGGMHIHSCRDRHRAWNNP